MDLHRANASPELVAIRFHPLLRMLLEASDRARALERDLWDFAVEVYSLRATGVTNNDLRWLLCEGYVEQAIERTRPDDLKRVFRAAANLMLEERTCFLLTQKGIDLARQELDHSAPIGLLNGEKAPPENGKIIPEEVPHWNQKQHVLYWRGQVVKHFRSEARNQEAILKAFQARKWVPCLSVVLSENVGVNSKDCLHDTIKNLNRNVRPHLRFSQEGNGSRVRWRPISSLP